MDYRDFATLQHTETLHFWYRARLLLIESLYRRLFLSRSSRILDVGCGTGTEIPLLAKYGAVTALDVNPYALSVAAKLNCTVLSADVATVKLPQASYEVACCFDVLEHIEDDVAAMRTVYATLVPGGFFLITVPAFSWLYSDHDRALAHFRRYEKSELIKKLQETGFIIEYVRYWNSLLFPLVAAVRMIKKVRNSLRINSKPVSEAATAPTEPFNSILYGTLALESVGPIARFCALLPFGLSLVVIVRKP